MKKTVIYLILCVFGFCGQGLQAQVLSVASGTDFDVKEGTAVAANGLDFIPALPVNFKGVNIARSATVAHSTAIPHISLAYQIDYSGAAPNYTGALQVSYKESELNGLPENGLKFLFYNGNAWLLDNGSSNNAANNLVQNGNINHLPLAQEITIGNCVPNTGDTTATACVSFSWYGTTYYSSTNTPTHTFTNMSGCDSVVTLHLTVNVLPAAPTISAVQPACNTNGVITVTNAMQGDRFSMDGLTYTNTTGIFGGLGAGIYNLTTKNEFGCISPAASVVLSVSNGTPVAAPILSVMHPTCASAYGSIRVTSTVFFNSFSIDGTNFNNLTGLFTGLIAGTYKVWVKNLSGCISAPSSIVVNPQPPTPAAPVITLTHPTCSVSTGIIVINNVDAGLTFSNNNFTYLNTTGVFTGVVSGSYNVTAKNAIGCISTATPVVINAKPAIPATPTATITQPTCSANAGSIVVTNVATGNSYSINGSAFSNTTGLFSGLAAGSYSIIAKNAAGCISAAKLVTVNAQPSTPAAPSLTVTQPSATLATGTIKVTSSLFGNSFSINNSAFTNITGVFSGLSTGFYNITAKNSSGCVSPVATATVGSGLSRGTQTEPPSETDPAVITIPAVAVISVTEKLKAPIPVEVASDLFEMSAFPNPTTTDFRININSASSETIKVTVYDMFGRRVKYFTFGAKQSINLGQDLKAGVYLIEARQGENMKALKVVKF